MRIILGTLALAALSACMPAIPDSGAVGEDALPPDGAVIPAATISDEQDFQAVAARETIESDAERIARNREQYVIVQPTELPARPGDRMSLVVEYALATTNSRGQPLFERRGFLSDLRFARNCAKYPSSDLAQEAFLRRGGPERDPMGLDPDGDGFACYWDPEPFRQARLAAGPMSPPADEAPLDAAGIGQ